MNYQRTDYPSTACALLEFAEAPTHILRIFYSVDICITTIMSPALDIAALCLSLWPAGDLQQQLQSVSLCHLTADIRISSCKDRVH